MNSSLDFLLLLVAAVALIGFLIVRRLRRLDDTGSTPNEFRIAAFYPRIARQAGFEPRTSWVLDCRDYAYTAQFDEHEACDSQYSS